MLGEQLQLRLNPLTSVTACMFTQFGECHHRDRKCHGLRNASRCTRSERVKSVVIRTYRIIQRRTENRGIVLRSQPGGAAS